MNYKSKKKKLMQPFVDLGIKEGQPYTITHQHLHCGRIIFQIN